MTKEDLPGQVGFGVRKAQAHLVLKLARDIMGNKKSFYHHISNKGINNENVQQQLLNRSGHLLPVDADKALYFTGKVMQSFVPAEFKKERNNQYWKRTKTETS